MSTSESAAPGAPERKKTLARAFKDRFKKTVGGSPGKSKDTKSHGLFRTSIGSTDSTPRGSTPSTPRATDSPTASSKQERGSLLAQGTGPGTEAQQISESSIGSPVKAALSPQKEEFSSPAKSQESAFGTPSNSPIKPSSPGKSPTAEAHLATSPEPGAGGGTVLPFGNEAGPLQGYSTQPDPQGEHYTEVAREIADSHNSKRDQGSKLRKLAGFGLVAVALGAAGLYISSHPNIRPGKQSETEEQKARKRFWN